MHTESGWTAYTGIDLNALPPDLQQKILEAQPQQPIAEVTIKRYGLDPEQSELHCRVAPNGVLQDATRLGAARTQAYHTLTQCLQRELAAGLSILRDAQLP